MARFGDLEAAIMDVMWASAEPLRVREVVGALETGRPLAFNTVQTVMDKLHRKGWLNRSKTGRVYFYTAARSREDYVAGLMGEALAAADDRTASLMRLLADMDPAEVAELRAALDAAHGTGRPR